MDSNKKREILNKKFIERGGVVNFNPTFSEQEVKENTTPLEVILNKDNGSMLSKWEKELEAKKGR